MDRPETLLDTLATEAEERPAWLPYARFCRARARGLRREALEHVGELLDQAHGWPEPERRAFTRWLCGHLEARPREGRTATPQPLVAGLLRPALEAWTEAEPTDPLPHRWLGTLFGDYRHVRQDAPDAARPRPHRHLRRALELDPTDQPARRRLIELLTDVLYWQTHHLPAGYLDDPHEGLATADEALALAAGLADAEERAATIAALQDWRRLIADWLRFQADGGGDFASWCAAHGRSYAWSRNYYFQP